VKVISNLILVLLLLHCKLAPGQKLPEWKTPNKITLISGDTVFVFTVKESGNLKPVFNRTYYWFAQGQLHQSQGGVNGRLLQGEFIAQSRHNGLISKGNFQDGLKEGNWLSWYPTGVIKSKIFWQDGQRQGRFYEYTNYGTIAVKGTFKNDQLHGKWITYDRRKIIGRYRYKDGTLVQRDTSSSNKKTFLLFKKFKRDSTQELSKKKKRADAKNQITIQTPDTYRTSPSNGTLEPKRNPEIIEPKKKRRKKILDTK